jgi:virginiamycin B lyase
MTKKNFPWMAACTVAIAGAAVMASYVLPVLAQDLPPGNGKEMVQTICGGCHDLTPITDSVGFSKEDWNTVVEAMISMGASIKPEQIAVITDYLAKNFPPKK